MSRHLFCVAFFVAGCAFAAQAQEPLPSVQQVMSDHKEKINNQIETINYKRKRVVEAIWGSTVRKPKSSGRSTLAIAMKWMA
ncbi:hypothetical protein PUP66_15940 [Pseudomonas chlororaphis]|uniref:hypothetical protein n=1 Tax=Pseudomonas chlororaphis TaxID=587753 RepID=UPI001F07DA84|nr:hypothetical protein [Pseudomonas chlororaphis]WDH44616.1 hypothetical protein PUP66_15940 [Pseudomonas chlororaphis]WDH56463.1 hypothetical protein PUP56_15945 [Pseudomonas chlororaphis]WQE21422.1 hypothetical protein U0007_14755 [Pseudomonas chlororaphis]